MNKIQKVQKASRTRMLRFRKRRKAARFTQFATRKIAQTMGAKYGIAAMPMVGTGVAVVGFATELLDCFVDIPWYGQLLVGPLVGLGDVAYATKTGELIP